MKFLQQFKVSPVFLFISVHDLLYKLRCCGIFYSGNANGVLNSIKDCRFLTPKYFQIESRFRVRCKLQGLSKRYHFHKRCNAKFKRLYDGSAMPGHKSRPMKTNSSLDKTIGAHTEIIHTNALVVLSIWTLGGTASSWPSNSRNNAPPRQMYR